MLSMTGAPLDVVAAAWGVLGVLDVESLDEPHPQSATTAATRTSARDMCWTLAARMDGHGSGPRRRRRAARLCSPARPRRDPAPRPGADARGRPARRHRQRAGP